MPFEQDIQPTLISETNGIKTFQAQILQHWLIVVGPNGGFIAALFARALTAALNDPERLPRSLTIDYFSVPQLEPVSIETKILRAGRSLTSCYALMKQNDKIIAQANASFSTTQTSSIDLPAEPMPDVLPPEKCQPLPPMLPIHANYDMRPAFGAVPFAQGDRAISGGWTKLKQPPQQLNPETIAAISDAWPPALFSIMSHESFQQSKGMPTIELSVYFVAPENYPRISQNDYLLARFQAREASQGFFTEDGDIWSQQGQLLARARQIAIAR